MQWTFTFLSVDKRFLFFVVFCKEYDSLTIELFIILIKTAKSSQLKLTIKDVSGCKLSIGQKEKVQYYNCFLVRFKL